LTLAVFLVSTFVLGFVADPVINFYLDPYGSFSSRYSREQIDPFKEEDEVSSWSEHFIKGFASLGVLGFLKVFVTSPWRWWNVRSSGFRGGRAGSTGRDRVADISWVVLIIGIGTILLVSS
jgi:hypothetical protein